MNTKILLLLCLALISCNVYESSLDRLGVNPLNKTNVEDEPCEVQGPPDFEEIHSKIFKVHCNGCHGMFVMPAFENYQSVFSQIVRIEGYVRRDRMPPDYALPQDLKDLLFQWIQEGSPEVVEKPPGPLCLQEPSL